MTRAHAIEILPKLVAVLPEELKPHVEVFNLRAVRSFGMRVAIAPKYFMRLVIHGRMS